MRNIKRFATVLISAITQGIGSDNERHPADVRNKGFCLRSEELCRRNCLTVLRQERAYPLSTTVACWPFKSCDEYWVKQGAFRKMEQRKTQSPLGLSISCFTPKSYVPVLLHSSILSPFQLLCDLVLLMNPLVPALPWCLSWNHTAASKPSHLKLMRRHVGNASYHLCKVCEIRNRCS